MTAHLRAFWRVFPVRANDGFRFEWSIEPIGPTGVPGGWIGDGDRTYATRRGARAAVKLWMDRAKRCEAKPVSKVSKSVYRTCLVVRQVSYHPGRWRPEIQHRFEGKRLPSVLVPFGDQKWATRGGAVNAGKRALNMLLIAEPHPTFA